jgi:hypothetical protein
MSVIKQTAYQNDLFTQQTVTTALLTGASSTSGDEWHDMNWREVHQEARRLQTCIVKAKAVSSNGR